MAVLPTVSNGSKTLALSSLPRTSVLESPPAFSRRAGVDSAQLAIFALSRESDHLTAVERVSNRGLESPRQLIPARTSPGKGGYVGQPQAQVVVVNRLLRSGQ